MPKRDRRGAVTSPARVVAPISVKRFNWNGWMCTRSLPDDQVNAIVLHRWIEDFLDRRH